MLAALLATSAFLVADATPPPAIAPLREVVYKVSTSLEVSGNVQSYEGMNTSNNFVTDQGTVTVDIMVIQNNVLGMDVTEVMDKKGTKSKYQGNVTADGVVNFSPSSINDASRELLPYFGPQFLALDAPNVGSKWVTSLTRSGAKVDTQYTVTKIDGPLLTLGVNQKVAIQSNGAAGNTTGSVVFKPSLLVPVSGDLHKVFTQTTPEGFVKQTLSVHFERVSDSRDK
jgi:hypothetical protein